MRRTLLDKLNTLKMRQALVLITLFLLPSAAWGEPNSVTYTFGSPDLDNNTVVSTTGQATSTSWNIKNLKISNNSYSLNKSESTLGFSVSGSNSAQTATISFDLISDFGITGTVTRIDIEYNTGSKISSGTFSAGKDLENITESLFDNKALETSTSDKTLSFSIPPGNNYHQFFKNDKIHLNFSFSANLSDVSNVYFNIKSITIHTNTISVGGYCPNETGAIIGGNITSYSGKDGDVSSVGYDATNHILTLENAKIQGYLYYSEDADLTIKLIGDNAFFAINNSIGDVLTIIQSTGTQKLTIQKDGQNASLKLFSAFSGSTAPNWDDINLISGFSNTNTELTVLESTNGSNLPGYNQNGKLVAYTTLSLKVAGNSPTTNGTISGSGIEGSVLFDVSSNELTLDNTTISGPIEWNNGNNDLTLYLKGKNSVIINKGESSPVSVFKSESSCSLKVEKVYQAESATLKYASYGTIDGKTSDVASYFDNFILSANTAFNQATSVIDGIRYNYLTTADTYNISVAGIQVHGIEGELGYKNNILNDTGESIVMFDGTNTLTLNNAKISSLSSTHAIETGLSTLNIDLKGNNSITTEGGYALYGATSSSSYRIIFTSSSDPVGNLTLKKSSGYLASYVTIDYDTNTGLVPTIITPTDASDLAAAREAIIAKGTALGITVAGVVVTNSNYTDIKGDGITVEEGGKVMFDTSTNTLTLNGAVLTAPIIIGLSELTIDIQGTNSITTNTTCIQNQENTTPVQLTFKSTSAEVGSLTLTNTSDNSDGVINNKYFEKFTISNELALIMLRSGGYTSNTYYFTAGEVHNAQIVPSYGVQVESAQILQVYEGNANDILGDGTDTKEPTVSFDKTTNTLTLNGASGISNISTTLSTLNIELVGSNSLNRSSNGSIFDSSSGEAVTINLKSTSTAMGSLTIETESNSSAKFKGDNVTLTPVDPIVLLSGDLTSNSGTLKYGALSAPTMSSETVDGVSTLTLVSTADNGTIKYSIDYVDASQTDITDAIYDSSHKPTISKPATVTAKVTLNEVESATTTGKYFGTDPSPFRLISGADPIVLDLTPAIEESDGISITSITGTESNVTYDAGTGKISSSSVGSFNGQVSMSSTEGKTVILNNNFTATFNVQIDISQAVITLDNTELIYNGQEQTVSVQKVMVGDDVVPQDYYEVSGNTGTEIGNYTLTVTAKTRDSQGNLIYNNYTGTATKEWKITNHPTASASELGFNTETQTFSTYYNPNEDFNLPDGYVGYIIKGIEGSKVLTVRISYIPKGVAVLVEKGSSSEETIEEIPSELPLKGTFEPLDVTSITGGTVYVLYNGMFVKSTSGTIPEKRCYLLIDTSVAAGTRGFYDIGGANDGTSALRGVVAEGTNGKSDAWYTLQGRRLSAKPSAPGLYLCNGKKVVIK